MTDGISSAVDSLDQFSVAKAVTSLDQNPDEGARALALSKATGAPPSLIHNDMDGFENQYRTKLTADIIGRNATIANYVRHHPLADVVSNDDYGNLDNFTRSAPIPTWLRAIDDSAGSTWLAASTAGVERAAQRTYEAVTAPPVIEPGTTFVPYLSAVGDIANRAFAAFMAPVTGFASGFAEEAVRQTVGPDAARQVGYSAEREAESFLQALPGFTGGIHETAGTMFRAREMEAASNAQAFRDAAVAHTEALNRARPYLDVGQMPPRGVYPLIDQASELHNAEYIKQLGEHLTQAQAALTKERSPEYFQWIADKVNNDHSVSVDGDVVAQLYGDKLPAPDDGLLGWVPGIEEKLAQARDSGTRVSIPTGAMMTHMDPAVFRELSPWMRAWEGGISAEDAKVPWVYTPTIDAPLPNTRAVMGTEPLFGVGDRPMSPEEIATSGQDPATVGPAAIQQMFGPVTSVEDYRTKRGVLEQTDRMRYAEATATSGEAISGEVGADHIQAQLDAMRANALGLDQRTYRNIQRTLQERYEADVAASLKRAEKDQKATQTKTWKAEAEVIAKDVSFDIIRRPDVMADQFIGAGKLIGEQLPSKRYSLGSQYLTPEQKSMLPRHYYSAEGLPPDYVAKILGIPDGATMLDSIARFHSDHPGMSANERLEAATKFETDRRMEEKFGNLQKNILLDAQDQALSENDINLVMEEWQAIAMRDGGLPIDKEAVKANAIAAFGRQDQKAATYAALLRQVGDLGKAAHDFLANGDSPSALIALQRRAVAMVQAAEAKKLEKLQGQFDKWAKQSNKQFNAGYTATIDPTHNLFVQQILNQVGRTTRRTMDDIAEFTAKRGFDSLQAFSDAAVADGKEMPIWPQLFDRNWKKGFKDLTVDEFKAVAQTVQTIIHNGKEEMKLEFQGQKIDKAAAKVDLIQAIADSVGGKVYLKDEKTGLKSYYVSNLQMENIIGRWDGFNYRGKWNQYVLRDLIDSANRADAVKKEFAKRIEGLGVPSDLKANVPNDIFYHQDKGTPLAFQRKNLLAVMLNMGTEDNFNKLAAGYGVDRARIEAWVNNHATEADWKWVRGIWDIFGDLKGRSDTMYRSLTGGVEAANIPGRIVPTRFGSVQGDYYPIMWHPDMVGGEQLEAAKNRLFSQDYTRAPAKAGYTIGRKENVVKPMDLSLDRFPARIAEEIHDIETRPALLNAAKVFYDKEILSAVNKHYGGEYKDLMQPYLEGVANVAVRNTRAMALMDSWSEFMRQNTIAALIGFNPITVLKHAPTAAVLSVKEVGPAAFAKTFAEVVPSEFLRWTKSLVGMDDRTTETNWQFAMKNSFELQRRDRNWMENLYGAASGLITPGDTWTPFRQRVMQWGAKPVALSDMISAVPTWLAKYNAEMAEHGVHGDAVSAADYAVRRAHGTTAVTGRTAFQRDKSPWLTSVYNFFSDVMNRQMESIWKAGVEAREAKEDGRSRAMAVVPGLTANMFTYLIWPAIVEFAATEGTGGGGVANEDDPYWWVGAKQLGFAAASSWPVVREFSAGFAFGREPQYGMLGTLFGIGAHEARSLHKVYEDIKDTGELDDAHAAKLIQDSSLFVGAFTGLPGGMAGKGGKFLWNVHTGEEEPRNPWEWAKGLTHGKIRRSE
jgi:Large polyvalent protein associated domain 22